jgi:predicted phosphatase
LGGKKLMEVKLIVSLNIKNNINVNELALKFENALEHKLDEIWYEIGDYDNLDVKVVK